MSSGTCVLRAKLPSTLEAVEEFCKEFRVWRIRNCGSLGAFGAELLIREALTNSVVHGCSRNPEKHVCCILRAKKSRFLIVVRDEGAGFDWRAAWDRSLTLSGATGRGIPIFRRYANRVRFNPQGNAVSLLKLF